MKKDNVRHFFYGNGKTKRRNCFWIEYGIKKYLVSYQTIVCSVDDRGKFEKYWNDYSATTQNQINQFIALFGKDTVIKSDTGEIINHIGKHDYLAMECNDIDENAYNYIRNYIPEIEWNYTGYNDYVKKIIYD